MVCKKCNTANSEDATFCKRCGNALTAEKPQDFRAPSLMNSKIRAPLKTKNMKTLWILGIVSLCVLVLCGTGYWFYQEIGSVWLLTTTKYSKMEHNIRFNLLQKFLSKNGINAVKGDTVLYNIDQMLIDSTSFKRLKTYFNCNNYYQLLRTSLPIIYYSGDLPKYKSTPIELKRKVNEFLLNEMDFFAEGISDTNIIMSLRNKFRNYLNLSGLMNDTTYFTQIFMFYLNKMDKPPEETRKTNAELLNSMAWITSGFNLGEFRLLNSYRQARIIGYNLKMRVILKSKNNSETQNTLLGVCYEIQSQWENNGSEFMKKTYFRKLSNETSVDEFISKVFTDYIARQQQEQARQRYYQRQQYYQQQRYYQPQENQNGCTPANREFLRQQGW